MTARRRAALRKAQLASARKRKGRRAAYAGAGVAAIGFLAYRKSSISHRHRSAWYEARLIQSYENTGAKYGGRKMPFKEVVSHARYANKSFKKSGNWRKQFKKDIRKTIRKL